MFTLGRYISQAPGAGPNRSSDHRAAPTDCSGYSTQRPPFQCVWAEFHFPRLRSRAGVPSEQPHPRRASSTRPGETHRTDHLSTHALTDPGRCSANSQAQNCFARALGSPQPFRGQRRRNRGGLPAHTARERGKRDPLQLPSADRWQRFSTDASLRRSDGARASPGVCCIRARQRVQQRQPPGL